ncbi:hypothetical protein PF010_g4610 [Phytophthora fragariae]|uniref:Secreted protein n=1 Tax=Phytophthora fragariae TaxID=53985 RepID=A0A6G0PHC9_9STRA|nr:hypothetical protein PF010_g4610 [Phytophthora fragariae]KAE9246393.1 hypothetical protein PF004_g4835 [Phytophthora fragariae]
MFLLALWLPGFFTMLMAALLSHHTGTGTFCWNPISLRRSHSHSLSLAPSLGAMRFASAAESDTRTCLPLHHDTLVMVIWITYPDTDLRSLRLAREARFCVHFGCYISRLSIGKQTVWRRPVQVFEYPSSHFPVRAIVARKKLAQLSNRVANVRS